jgi:hypothetical protein
VLESQRARKFQLETEVNIKKKELSILEADIAEKEIKRQALVIQNAKLSGIPEGEIEQYQLQRTFDLLEEISKTRMRQLLEKGLL